MIANTCSRAECNVIVILFLVLIATVRRQCQADSAEVPGGKRNYYAIKARFDAEGGMDLRPYEKSSQVKPNHGKSTGGSQVFRPGNAATNSRRLPRPRLEFPLVECGFCGNRGTMTGTKVTADTIREMKSRGEKIAALTAYDFPMTRLLDEVGVPLLLVGDSLGMVVLGYANTTQVTMAEMEHHVRAAARAQPRALLAADLPYRSYDTVESAVANAKRLAAAGAEAVKAEGGREILPQVSAIIASGIPFLGHLGMLPQHVLEEGGYRIKGKKEAEHQELLLDADALVKAGAFAMVLELVEPRVAKEITLRIPIPTIGIGAGPDCDGQILVTPDLLGMLPWYSLKHVKPKLNAAEQMRAVVKQWKDGVSGSANVKERGSVRV